MRKILSLLGMFALVSFCLIVFSPSLRASSEVLQVTASTYTVSGASVCTTGNLGVGVGGVIIPDVAGVHGYEQIVIHQPSTVAQTVTFYKLGASSKTITAVWTDTIPGTAGLYYPFSESSLPSNDAIIWTDFVVRTDTTTSPVKVNLIRRR